MTTQWPFAACMLHHHDSVGARWNGRAGHDLHSLATADFAVENVAGANLADHLELSRQVDGAQGEAVADRAGKRRRVAIGGQGCRQYAAHGCRQADSFGWGWGSRSADRLEDGFARVGKRQWRHIPIMKDHRFALVVGSARRLEMEKKWAAGEGRPLSSRG